MVDTQVEEKEQQYEEKKNSIENIDTDGITEEQFVEKAIEKIGEIKKDPKNNKVLDKDCFIKIFKYTGDFAKLKSKELKKKS